MNKKEAAKIISIMQINYPDSFKGKSDEMMMATINLWAKMFEPDSAEDVTAAVMAHMAADTNRFIPPVGVIKDRLTRLRQPDGLTEQDAWAHVAKALRSSIYNSAKEFESLPPAVQQIVGSPNQLREWAVMDSGTVQSVVASNFQRSYRARAANEREFQSFPAEIKKEIERMSHSFRLSE